MFKLVADSMKLKIALFSALAAALGQNSGQQTPPDTVIRINVNLVQMDAVVHDDKDRPVTDLKKEDFEILQDGKPQEITNFAYVALPPEPGASPTVRTAANSGSKGKNEPPPPPVRLRPDQVRRTVALVVDDLGLSFESVAYTRRALKDFIDKQMEPGDLVAIIRTGAGMGALQQFTADKRLLYAALDKVKFNSMGRVGPNGGSSGFDEARAQAFSVGTLGAIRYVVEGLRDLPGRKQLLLFSENLRLFYGREGVDPRTIDALRRLVDSANRSSVVINSIDPRGLQTYQLSAAADTSKMSQRQIAQAPMRQAARVFNSQDGRAEELGDLLFACVNVARRLNVDRSSSSAPPPAASALASRRRSVSRPPAVRRGRSSTWPPRTGGSLSRRARGRGAVDTPLPVRHIDVT